MLKGFPTDKVKLIKSSGEEIFNIDALVDKDKIFIDDGKLLIEEGDIIQRKLPNGLVEDFEVLNRGFYKGMGSIPDHYQTEVRKKFKNISKESINITYNINNESGKVNIRAVDNSINIQLSKDEESLFDTLEQIALNIENNENIKANIYNMKINLGKPVFVAKYNEFIQSVANHMTIFAPCIPALTKFLG